MKTPRLLWLSALALLPALLAAYLLLQRSGTTAELQADGRPESRNVEEIAKPGSAASLAPAQHPTAPGKSSVSAMSPGANDRSQERDAIANTDGAAALPAARADAALSLADALQRGDARSPPIAHDSPPQEAATAAELADPVAYRRYENRQQARLYRAYEREAAIALSDMQRDLQRARAQNLSAELIAEGEEKARMLQQTLEAVRNGEMR